MRKLFLMFIWLFFFNSQVTKEQRNVGLALRILDEVECFERNLASELSAPLRWRFRDKLDCFFFLFY